ncbi:uncharacterized protein LOC122859676 [Aphidius gifuensis]|uniref:uncharacterized protein LOC122859676 n=1 Tax=Aphidius gifuensis TaxID=684658 RepID=UPI001CDB74D3|nr:uncharacterized protein LOC122859676 [Aphidius gifuensis]
MVVGEPSIHNIMGGMESTGGVRLHNHKRKLKQRFDIIKKLGQGTYGKVQLGINKETGQEVAIKTIKKCKIETEADLIRIRREIQIMSSVQHPNIIHIYEVFENREKMVLVMEYAAGGELYDYLSERKVLSEEEARRIFRQITIAVFYCHKHKICHRDLKLENILLDLTGNAKIADFGLSNVFDERRLLNTFCGSPLYASPEIVKGTPYHGPEVDCWSLGVLLYTLVYGAMPFDGSNFKRLTRQISASDYFEPKIPSSASPLIKDMLQKCPTQRADIEKICSHWWVNKGYDINCLDIAENLAAQTPVRLDLLLSLVPQSASADKLVIDDDSQTNQQITHDNNMSNESTAPTRCHSVGSLMELDRNNSEKIREMINEEEPKNMEIKRKLETTPSMEETHATSSKKKDKTCQNQQIDNRDLKNYATNSRHHSAPITTNTIKEEQMEVDLRNHNSNELNLIKEALVLQFIKEEEERNKEQNKTSEQVKVNDDNSNDKNDDNINKKTKEITDLPVATSVANEKLIETENKVKTSPKKTTKTKKTVSPKKFQVSEVKVDSSQVEIKQNNELIKTDNNEEEKSDTIEIKKLDDNTEKIDKKNNIGVLKKPRQRAVSMDSDEIPLTKQTERRRSKIFETAEKFNQLGSSTINTDIEKPKKIFIPGVNVGGAKRVFERKASLGSMPPSPPIKQSTSKIIIDVPKEKTIENEKIKDDDKKRAVDIITGALGKPPVLKKLNGSPPLTPTSSSSQSTDSKKLGLKIQLAPNDVRNATVSVTTPTETKYPDFDNSTIKPLAIGSSVPTTPEANQQRPVSPTMSSKIEITLKSATLPRRKTSKAEITLAGYKSNNNSFKSEVEAKINACPSTKLRTQKSEVAFPVSGIIQQPSIRSSSLGPDNRQNNKIKERIIPIQFEEDNQELSSSNSFTIPSKPPMPQRSISQKSESLSRQSTADSDTDSLLGGSTTGGAQEKIKKSPREYIIPISVEGGGYVTPRSGSLEPESKNSTPTSVNPSRSRFGRPRRIGSLLSDASEDESPFSTLHRDSDDLLHRHMHRLRSSRPIRQTPEHADSLSSGEDDEDDDGFELLTAENLFSTLLSRVRSLTQRLNVDDTRGTGFPSSRLLGRMGSNSSSQGFWGVHEPLSSYESSFETQTITTRIPESPFRRPLSRDPSDRFGRKDSALSSTSATQSSLGGRSERNPSRESIFDVGSSNTLPRDDQRDEDDSLTTKDHGTNGLIGIKLSPSRDDLTPCLARRLSRQFIEKTRQLLPRSPSIPRERLYRSSTEEPSSILDKPLIKYLDINQITINNNSSSNSLRRDNSLRTDKIQEETAIIDDNNTAKIYNDSIESNKQSMSSICDTNYCDATPSLSVKSFDTSPTESTSNIQTDSMNSLKADAKDFECRLLAAENLIKETKLRSLGLQTKYEQNNDNKCDNELLGSINDLSSLSKRRSCIPSLRLRSESLNRDVEWSSGDRRKTLGCTNEKNLITNDNKTSPERSLLSKLFRSSSSTRETDKNDKSPRKRISRFLRPDFFDTPREESQYVKDKEAQKAAENERRKTRFMRLKNDKIIGNNNNVIVNTNIKDNKPEKELKNKVNTMTRDKFDNFENEKATNNNCENKTIDDTKIVQNLDNNNIDKLINDIEIINSKCDKNDEQFKKQQEPIANTDKLNENETKKSISSMENLILNDTPVTSTTATTKSKVSSVFGLFKNDSKTMINGTKPSTTLLSKFKKNTYKGSRSDTSVITGESSSSSTLNSKIPTKSKPEMKNDVKNTKKIISDTKRSPEKSEIKKTIIKEKIKEKTPPIRSSVERKLSIEKQQNKLAKKSPDKIINTRKSTPEKSDNKNSLDNNTEIVIKKDKNLNELPDNSDKITINNHENDTKEISKNQNSNTQITSQDDNEIPHNRANRSNLKLDLSKVQQYTFNNPPDKIQSTSSNNNSKAMTHHANIMGNKIVNDKALKSEDYHQDKISTKSLDLSDEIDSSKHELINDNTELINNHKKNTPPPTTTAATTTPTINDNKKLSILQNDNKEKLNIIKHKLTPDTTEDILSPMDDNESFDSWSICSNDLNHRTGSDIQSPTSPGYSPLSRNDHQESIIDRIRRKSFYSRFNERKRKPTTLTNSSTLPRKYSFNNLNKHDDDDNNDDGGGVKRNNKKMNSYSLNSSPTGINNDRTLSLYTDELLSYRKSPIDKYSDTSCSLLSPTDKYSKLKSSYDTLRRYRVSPLPDTSSHCSKYLTNSTFSYDPSDNYNKNSSSTGLSRDESNCSIDYHRNHRSSTLPRKYNAHNSLTRNNSIIENKKTADYYEDLLTPSNIDYLTMKKKQTTTKLTDDFTGKYNGDSDIVHKWKNNVDKYSTNDSPDDSDKSHDDDNLRCETASESKELSAACPDDSDDMTTIE